MTQQGDLSEALAELVENQIRRVRDRVRDGAYAHETTEVRRAASVVGPLVEELSLRGPLIDLKPGTAKPQFLLGLRDATGHDPVVLKVYGRRRPNEAAVQAYWSQSGVATPRILASGDCPVSWLLMPLLPGRSPRQEDALALTEPLAIAMRAAHRLHHPDVGEACPLFDGIVHHLHAVVSAATAHGYSAPRAIVERAEAVTSSPDPTFLHGDLAVVNLLTDGSTLHVLDTCGYTGPVEFDAARWCARTGGAIGAERELARWLGVEPGLDHERARSLLALELVMEAGVREIVKDERGERATGDDPVTVALLDAARTVAGE